MRTKIKFSGCLGLLAIVATGCAPTSSILIAPMDRFVNETVGPEYELYIAADETLDAFQKQIRFDNVSAMRAVVDSAKGGQ